MQAAQNDRASIGVFPFTLNPRVGNLNEVSSLSVSNEKSGQNQRKHDRSGDHDDGRGDRQLRFDDEVNFSVVAGARQGCTNTKMHIDFNDKPKTWELKKICTKLPKTDFVYQNLRLNL